MPPAVDFPSVAMAVVVAVDTTIAAAAAVVAMAAAAAVALSLEAEAVHAKLPLVLHLMLEAVGLVAQELPLARRLTAPMAAPQSRLNPSKAHQGRALQLNR